MRSPSSFAHTEAHASSSVANLYPPDRTVVYRQLSAYLSVERDVDEAASKQPAATMNAGSGTVLLNFIFAFFIICGFFMMRYRIMKLHELSELGRPLLGHSCVLIVVCLLMTLCVYSD